MGDGAARRRASFNLGAEMKDEDHDEDNGSEGSEDEEDDKNEHGGQNEDDEVTSSMMRAAKEK